MWGTQICGGLDVGHPPPNSGVGQMWVTRPIVDIGEVGSVCYRLHRLLTPHPSAKARTDGAPEVFGLRTRREVTGGPPADEEFGGCGALEEAMALVGYGGEGVGLGVEAHGG